MNDHLKQYLQEYAEEQSKYIQLVNEMIKTNQPQLLNQYPEITNHVPKYLFHGSTKAFLDIKPNESTQKGNYVYATDNPLRAIHFALFRDSAKISCHIYDGFDQEQNYQFHININEKQKGSFQEVLNQKYVYLYVVDGKQFMRPQGEIYHHSEFISKEEGKSIAPSNIVAIDVKKYFEGLKQQGKISYSPYTPEKDYKTILELFSGTYLFNLGTERVQKNMPEFQAQLQQYLLDKFPDKVTFANNVKQEIDEIYSWAMAQDGLTQKQKEDLAITNARKFTNSFFYHKNGERVYDSEMIKQYENIKKESR